MAGSKRLVRLDQIEEVVGVQGDELQRLGEPCRRRRAPLILLCHK